MGLQHAGPKQKRQMSNHLKSAKTSNFWMQTMPVAFYRKSQPKMPPKGPEVRVVEISELYPNSHAKTSSKLASSYSPLPQRPPNDPTFWGAPSFTPAGPRRPGRGGLPAAAALRTASRALRAPHAGAAVSRRGENGNGICTLYSIMYSICRSSRSKSSTVSSTVSSIRVVVLSSSSCSFSAGNRSFRAPVPRSHAVSRPTPQIDGHRSCGRVTQGGRRRGWGKAVCGGSGASD